MQQDCCSVFACDDVLFRSEAWVSGCGGVCATSKCRKNVVNDKICAHGLALYGWLMVSSLSHYLSRTGTMISRSSYFFHADDDGVKMKY